MGIDVETCVFAQPEIYISIHAPRMGIDRFGRRHRPVGGHFNPRSPDGERRPMPADKDRKALFQSTLPGWGATSRFPHRWPATRNFNPRPPGWGATTGWEPCSTGCTYFNPRSPDGERQNRKRRSNQMKDFNPRSPDGERHPGVILKTLLDEFQSTFPGWGATYTSPLPYIDA